VNPPPAVRWLCRPYWLRVGGVTLAAAVAVTAAFALVGSAPVLMTLQHALVHSLVMGGLTGAVLPWVMRRLWSASLLARWSVLVPVLLALAAAGTVIACSLLSLVHTHHTGWACVRADLAINALMVATIGVGMVLYEVQRSRLDAMTLELRTRELEHERALKMALEARLATLESRLHPHFLFNTLNAISALIHDDPDRAERTVERLAALLRFSLDATQEGVIPLGQEIKIVTDYLEIEHTRLGERLAYAMKVDPALETCAVPPLAVQTLVENSIKHAIAPRPHGGQVRVEASEAGDHVVLGVWDDGPGFTAADIRPGHGLENLQARLTARFGSSAHLTIEPHAGGTLVTILLPRVGGPMSGRIDGRER
jgi:two-component system, LytTR family, sensor histidine kinase AlgZ